MAGKFVLTAELNIQAPNMQRVVQQIQQQLGAVQVNVTSPNAPKVQQQISKVNKTLKNTGTSAKKAAVGFNSLSSSIGKSIGALIRYDIARKVINLFSQALEQGISDAIKFERELNKVAQVTGKSMAQIRGLEVEITRLSTSLGVSSMSLIKVTRVLAQTGMTANEVKISLDALAKTTLAPTFDDITNTTETAIAAMRQFRLEAKDLEGLLGSINKVAGNFAVEAGDIGVAIRRAGGAFRSAGGQVEELIALFTSVRSTTRETAETIATGFRTIFTRMQRPTTIKFLRQFGVELQDLNGKFVGPFEAVKRLNIALKSLDPRDVRYSQIVEQLGGFRQVSKVIPLIQEFETAQKALNVAQQGSGSLAADAAKAQNTFAVKIEKLKQEVKELFRVITESKAFRGMLDIAIGLAKAFTNVATALGPIIPLLTAIFAIKGIGMLGGILGGIGRGFKQVGARGYARGGIVPGTGTGDTVPAMLSPGEFVIRKSSVKAFGAGNLENINGYAKGGPVSRTGTQLAGGSADISRRIVVGKNREILNNLRGKPNVSKQRFNSSDTIEANIVPMKFDYERVLKGRKVVSDPTSSGAKWEKFVGEELGVTRQGVSNYPIDFVKGSGVTASVYEAKKGAWQVKEVLDKLLRHRIQSDTLPKGWTPDRDTRDVGRLNMAVPGEKTVIQQKKKKKASGGVITAQGTDSVPALLTPGEFVINRKSAQRVGYGNLGAINKYASGGMVGQQRKRMFGGGMMDMLMMGGMMGAGGGSGAESADDQLGNLARTTKRANKSITSFRGGLGAVTSGLGKVASGSLMAYAKVQFLGQMADQVATSLGIENEFIHKVINGLTSFAAIVFTVGTAMRMMAQVQMLQGIKAMFGSPVIKAMIGGGSRLMDMLGLAVLTMGKKIIPKGIRTRVGTGVGKIKGAFGQQGRNIAVAAKEFKMYRLLNKAGMSRADMLAKEAMHLGKLAKMEEAISAARAAGRTHVASRAAFPGSNVTGRGGISFRNAEALAAKQSRIAGNMGRGARAGGGLLKTSGALGKTLLKFGAGLAIFAIAFEGLRWGLESAADDITESVMDKGVAGANWSDVRDEALGGATMASMGAAVEGAATSAALVQIGTFAAEIAGINIVPLAGWIVAAGLVVAEIIYVAATWSDAMNDMKANFERAVFADEMLKVSQVLKGFEDGIVSAETAAYALNSGLDTVAARTGEIAASTDTGSVLGMGSWGWWGTDQDILDAAEAEWYKAHSEMVEAIPKIWSGVQQDILTSGAFGPSGGIKDGTWEGGDLAADRSAAEAELIRQLGGLVNATRQATLMGTTIEKLTEDFGDMADIVNKVSISAKIYEEAQRNTTRALLGALDIMLSIQSMEPVFDQLEARFSNIAGSTAGGFGSARVPSIAPQFTTEAVMAISTDEQFERLETNAMMVANTFGEAGRIIAEEFIGSARLMKVLPETMVELADDLNRLDFEGVADPGEKMLTLLEEKIGKAEFDSIPKFLRDKLSSQINAMTSSADGKNVGEMFAENQEAILAEMADNIDLFTEAMNAASSALIRYNKELGNALSQLSEVNNEMRGNRQSRIDMEFAGDERIARARGRDMTPASYENSFQRKRGAGLAGVMGRDRGTGQQTGEAAADMGVKGLEGLYVTQKRMLDASNKKLEDLAKASQGAGNEAGALGVEMKAAQLENAKLREETEQVKQALEAYTNVQQRLTGIQTALAKEQESRLAKRGVLSDFTFASDADRGSQVEGMQAAFKAIAAGDLGAVDDTQRGAVGQFLDRFENVSLEAFGGKTGGDIKKEFEIAELENMLPEGRKLTGEEKKRIMESTSEEERLISQMAKIQQEGLEAQDALFKGMGEDRAALTTAIEQLHQTFLSDLKDVMFTRVKNRLESDLKATEKAQEQVKGHREKATGILAGIFGEEGLAGMDPGAKDEKLKALANVRQQLSREEENQASVKAADTVHDTWKAANHELERVGAAASGKYEYTEQDDPVVVRRSMEAMLAKAMEMGRGDPTTKQGKAQNLMMAEMTAKFRNAMHAMMDQELTIEEAIASVGGDANMMAAFRAGDWDTGSSIQDYGGISADAMGGILNAYFASGAAASKAGAETETEQIRTTLTAAGYTSEQIDGVLENAGKVAESLAEIPPGTTFKALDDELTRLAATLQRVNDQLTSLKADEAAPLPPPNISPVAPAGGRGLNAGPVMLPWTGGLITKHGVAYRSRGGGIFTPRGTDTVPAMLTPGEYVIKKDAARAIGIPALQSLNSMGRSSRGFSAGGRVGYYNGGGSVGGGLDFSGLDASMNRFSQQVGRLSEVLGQGFSVNVGGTIDVNVRLSGAEMLEGAKDSLGELAVQKVQDGINSMLKTYFPQLNRKSGLHRPPGR